MPNLSQDALHSNSLFSPQTSISAQENHNVPGDGTTSWVSC